MINGTVIGPVVSAAGVERDGRKASASDKNAPINTIV